MRVDGFKGLFTTETNMEDATLRTKGDGTESIMRITAANHCQLRADCIDVAQKDERLKERVWTNDSSFSD